MAGYSLGTARGRIVIDRSDLNSASTALMGMGRTLGIVGVAGVAAFGLVVKTAADFEESISHMAAVTGLAGNELDKVREKALQLGRDSAYGAKEAADAMVELAKAGLSAKEILGGVADAVVTLAAAGDFPIQESADVLVSTLRTFNLEAKDAQKVADLLAGGANASLLEVQDLAVSMKYAAGVAATLGIPVGELVTVLAELGDRGIKASTAGTSLRRIFLQLSPTTEKQTKEMKRLGLITAEGTNQFYDQTGKLKPLNQVLGILSNAYKGMSNEQKVASLNILFGNRAVSAAAILVDEGAKGYEKYWKAIDGSSAAEVMEKRLDNLNGALKKLKASIETAFITAGSPVQNVLKNFVKGLTALVNWFTKLPPGLQGALTWLLLIGGSLALVGSGLFFVAGGILKFFTIWRELSTALSLAKTVIGGVTSGLWRMAAAALANPYVLLAIAVVALIGGLVWLYFHSKRFRDIVDSIGRAISGAFGSVVNFFKNIPKYAEEAWNKLKEWGKDLGKALKKNVGAGIGLGLAGPVGAVAGAIIQHWDKVKPALKKTWDWIKTEGPKVWDSLKRTVANLPSILGSAIGAVAGTAVRWAGEAVNSVGEILSRVWNSILSWLSTVPERVGEILGLVVGTIVRWGAQALQAGVQFSAQVFSGIMQALSQLPTAIWNIASTMISTLTSWLGQGIAAAWRFGSQVFTGIVNWVSQLPGKIMSFIQKIPGIISSVASAVWNKAVELGSKIFHGIISGIGDIVGWVGRTIRGIIGAIKDGVSAVGKAAADFGKGIWNGFKNALFGSPHTKVEYAVWDMRDNTKEAIRQMKYNFQDLASLHKSIPTDIPIALGSAAAARGGGTTTINRTTNVANTVNNPKAQTTEESLFATHQKLAYMGAFQ